jgi:hypothetical protein
MANEDPFAILKEHFSKFEDVIVSGPRGAQGIKYNGKMFVMFYKGKPKEGKLGGIIVQLSPSRVKELIELGEAKPFDPGTGKYMKDRVILPVGSEDKWIKYTQESREYVKSK